MGGGRDSLYKRKSSKRERDITSSQKKSRRKESKKHGSSSDSEHTSVSPSKSNHKRRIRKYKKLRHVYSTSSSSHDQSTSSYSDSSSDDYKRKKARKSRLGLKSNKKRGRQRSARPEGDGDASNGGKKNKRLGRDAVAKPKKKPSKKKLKKYTSSYSSSDSESCSTRKSDSTADDRKRKRSKIIFESEKERPRGRESHTPCKKRRIRSPSSSSCDRGSKHIDGALRPLNNDNNNNYYNGRLRSVIAVVDQRHDEGEENRWEMNSHKEEIVYDRNDYTSLKGPESNEEGNKMEIVNQSHSVGNIAGEEKCGKSRINEGRRQLEEVDMTTFEKWKEIGNSVPVADSGGDVLELILRQKALENLKKFKGRLQTGPMSTNNLKRNNVDRPSNVMVENIQNKSTEQEGDFNAREINQNSGLSRKSDISKLTEIKILACSENVDKMDRNSGLSRKSDISKLAEVKILSDSENVEKMDRNSGLSRKNDISKLAEVKILSDSENVEKMDRNTGLSRKSDISKPTGVRILSDSRNVEKMDRNSDVSQIKNPSKLTEVGKSLNSENVDLSRKMDLSQVRILSDSRNVEKMDRNSDVSQIKNPSKLTEVGKSLNSENVDLSRKMDLSQFRKLSDSKNVEKEPGMGTQTLEHPTDRDALLECSKEAKSVIPHAVLAETLSRIEACPGAETMNAGSSSNTEPSLCIESMSREHGLERGNEARDGSQYEQKTMSVMRGGEMVEVSYKVYIPKKAAALARRPLKR